MWYNTIWCELIVTLLLGTWESMTTSTILCEVTTEGMW